MLIHVVIAMRLFLFVLLLFGCFMLNAQPQNSTWYFGHHAGLKFDSAGNVTVLNDGALTSRESATCISDSNGDILLYSDGGRMYNKIHQVVANGDSLYCKWINWVVPWANGGYWGALAVDASILLPSFDGDSVYIMFTSNNGSNYGFVPGLVYNKINVNQNAVLLPKNNVIYEYTSNPELLSARIQAIRHANGRDWWLVTHKVFDDAFWVYLYDPYGLHGPYEQHIGQMYGFPAWGGTASSNRLGTKVNWVSPGGFNDVFDFDRCTGLLSNYLELGFPPYLQPTSTKVDFTAFSASGNVLYTGNGGSIYQYDLTAADPKSTETIIFSEPYFNNALPDSEFTAIGMLKLGPDNKIYVAKCPGDYPGDTTYQFNDRVKYLGVINDPEILGAGCNFNYYGLYLNGASSTFALPNTAYYLSALVGSGCDTIGQVIVVQTFKPNIRVHPNPFTDALQLDITGTNALVQIEVINVLGQMVYSERRSPVGNNFHQAVDLSILQPGVYVLRLTVNGESRIEKIIKH